MMRSYSGLLKFRYFCSIFGSKEDDPWTTRVRGEGRGWGLSNSTGNFRGEPRGKVQLHFLTPEKSLENSGSLVTYLSCFKLFGYFMWPTALVFQLGCIL